MTLVDRLREMEACPDAIRWVDAQDGSAYDMWRRCERGDWLLWLAGRAGVDRRLVVMAACACAREALVYVPTGEERPRIAIETAEAWCRGEVTDEQVGEAALAASDAFAAFASYAASAASAFYAVCAARAANADYAANAAAYAGIAVAPSARITSLAKSAWLVRRVIPWATVRDAMGAMQ